MTSDQAIQLLAAVGDLQQIGMGLGIVLGQCAIWLNIVSVLLLGIIYFQAVKRS